MLETIKIGDLVELCSIWGIIYVGSATFRRNIYAISFCSKSRFDSTTFRGKMMVEMG
jgi:hypothetical protein